MTGVTVVRDGEFLGVVAPTERARAPCGGGDPRRVADARRPAVVCDDLRAPEEDAARDRAAAATRRRSSATSPQARAAAAQTFDASYRIPYIAHVPLEPRAAVAEWTRRQADRLDRHAASVRRAVRAGRGVPTPGRSRARHRARHRLRVRRQAHGRARDRSRAPREGGGQAGEAGVDARGGVLVRLLPAGRRDRREGGRGCRRAAGRVGVRQLEFRRHRRSGRRTTSRTSASSSIRPIRRCGRARTAGSPPPRTTTRARCTWTRSRARSASTRSSSGCGT